MRVNVCVCVSETIFISTHTQKSESGNCQVGFYIEAIVLYVIIILHNNKIAQVDSMTYKQ